MRVSDVIPVMGSVNWQLERITLGVSLWGYLWEISLIVLSEMGRPMHCGWHHSHDAEPDKLRTIVIYHFLLSDGG